MTTTPAKRNTTHARITKATNEKLNVMARRTGTSKMEIIELAITRAYEAIKAKGAIK